MENSKNIAILKKAYMRLFGDYLMKKYYLYLLSLFSIVSCESWGGYQGLYYINNSDMEISFYAYSLLPISSLYGQFYPDTLLMQDTLPDYSLINIKPNSRVSTGTKFSYRDIKNGDIPYMNDTLMFFVFSRDTINKYSWEEIKRDYKILKRIDITGRELDDQDWTITYP